MAVRTNPRRRVAVATVRPRQGAEVTVLRLAAVGAAVREADARPAGRLVGLVGLIDLVGLLLDFSTGTLTLFINGARCGVIWDGLGDKKLNFCVELRGLDETPPPMVRLMPPPQLLEHEVH